MGERATVYPGTVAVSRLDRAFRGGSPVAVKYRDRALVFGAGRGGEVGA
jgi:hypothetical protein